MGKTTGVIAAEQGAKFKGLGTMAKIGLGIDAFQAYSDYKDAREEGSGVLSSTAYAASNFALNYALGWWMIPYQLAPKIPGAVVNSIEGIAKYQRQMNKANRRIPFSHSTFNDYRQAATMRQAGMQLAQNSQYNLQQALLGNEASNLR